MSVAYDWIRTGTRDVVGKEKSGVTDGNGNVTIGDCDKDAASCG